MHVTESLVRRLGLETELEGHSGCVNCLEWNESGRYSMIFMHYNLIPNTVTKFRKNLLELWYSVENRNQ